MWDALERGAACLVWRPLTTTRVLIHPDEMSRRPSNLVPHNPPTHTHRETEVQRRGEARRFRGGGGRGGGEPTPGTRLHAHYLLCAGHITSCAQGPPGTRLDLRTWFMATLTQTSSTRTVHCCIWPSMCLTMHTWLLLSQGLLLLATGSASAVTPRSERMTKWGSSGKAKAKVTYLTPGARRWGRRG